MTWLSIFIPCIIFVIFSLYKGWEWKALFISFGISLFVNLIGLIIGLSREEYLVTDTEYWTGYVTQAEYYEHWNERVSCRHPKYKTVTKTRRDSKGRTETYTEQVQDGYEHLYDVDDHPAYWQMHDNNGLSFGISQQKYNDLVRQFGNQNFVNLHRDYHTINGNKYQTHFHGGDDRMDICSHTHRYENRIQASSSVFKFRDVGKEEKEIYGLFDYPEVNNLHTPMILGFNDDGASRKLELLNAKLGNPKQIRVWILVFKNQPLEAAYSQEAYWDGGNKNELILIIGINDQNRVQWGHSVSWTDRQDIKVNSRNFIYEQQNNILDLSLLINKVKPLIEEQWERKQFKDFKYIEIDYPLWLIWLVYSLVVIESIIVCCAFYIEDFNNVSKRRILEIRKALGIPKRL